MSLEERAKEWPAQWLREGRAQDTRLIERWLPIAALGEESIRERRSMTALPPTYYLHVWWARRPLVASRAAVLASLLPADADREAVSARARHPRRPGGHAPPDRRRQEIGKAPRSEPLRLQTRVLVSA